MVECTGVNQFFFYLIQNTEFGYLSKKRLKFFNKRFSIFPASEHEDVFIMTVQFYSNAGVQQGDHLSPLLFLSYIRGRHTVKEALMAQLVLEIDNNKVGENKQI